MTDARTRTGRWPVVVCLVLAGAWAAPAGTQIRTPVKGPAVYWGTGLKARFGKRYAIKAKKILTMAAPGVIDGGVILVVDGKIQTVGPLDEVKIPAGFEVIDARDDWVTPGFIDLHCHNQAAAPEGWGNDLNDMVQQVNPALRTLDTLRPENEWVRNALAAGVTTALFIPGSGTNLSGWGVVVKTAGSTPEEIVVRYPGALKVAQAGNPERQDDLGRTRMGMNWLIRNALERGRRYHEAWQAYEEGRTTKRPQFRPDLENFRGLFEGLYPVIIHTQIAQVFQSTMRIFHDEVKVPHVIQSHASFDSFKNAPEIARRHIFTDAGPRGFYLDPDTGRYLGLAALWWEGGVRNLTVNTDAPIVSQAEHWYQGTMAARFGLDEQAAIRGLTLKNAEALGLADRLGSLAPGKDADLQIRTGSPLDVTAYVKKVLIDGVVVYDAKRDGRRF